LRQKFLKLVGASSVYQTVCWIDVLTGPNSEASKGFNRELNMIASTNSVRKLLLSASLGAALVGFASMASALPVYSALTLVKATPWPSKIFSGEATRRAGAADGVSVLAGVAGGASIQSSATISRQRTSTLVAGSVDHGPTDSVAGN
jgi:hypothetical protein